MYHDRSKNYKTLTSKTAILLKEYISVSVMSVAKLLFMAKL